MKKDHETFRANSRTHLSDFEVWEETVTVVRVKLAKGSKLIFIDSWGEVLAEQEIATVNNPHEHDVEIKIPQYNYDHGWMLPKTRVEEINEGSYINRRMKEDNYENRD